MILQPHSAQYMTPRSAKTRARLVAVAVAREPLLDRLEQRRGDERLVRAGIDAALVTDAPAVDRIGQQLVQMRDDRACGPSACAGPRAASSSASCCERHDARGVALEGEADQRSASSGSRTMVRVVLSLR